MGLLLLEQVDPHLAHPLHHHSGGAHSEASHRQAAHPIGHMALLSFRDSVAALPIDHLVLLSFRDSVAAHPLGDMELLSLRNDDCVLYTVLGMSTFGFFVNEHFVFFVP